MISKAGATKDFTVLVVLSTDLQESGCFNRFTRRRVLVYGGVGLLSTYLQVFKVGVGCFSTREDSEYFQLISKAGSSVVGGSGGRKFHDE